MKRLSTLFFMLIMVFSAAPQAQEVQDMSATIDIFKSSPQVRPYFNTAYGYAVFPTIGKAGFIFAGAHGKGQVYKGGRVTGLTSMTQATVGLQIGGQAYREIIFFQDKRAYDDFTSGNFEFEAGASAIAITSGADARATTGSGGTTSTSGGSSSQTEHQGGYYKGMAAFVDLRGGFMLEAAIGGQKFSYTPLQ